MSKSKRAKPPALPRGDEPELLGEPKKTDVLSLIVCAVVALALIVMVWSVVRRTGDLYVGYAGGRDVVDGKIGFGQKDDWCFNTTDKIWFNQNWGTHVVYYYTWIWGGPMGYLTLKMALLLLAATGIVLGARERGAGWPVGILVAGSILISGHAYIDLRPNLTTLAFAPVFLWLLYRTRRNPHRIWWAVAFMTLWANMHGGFVLGLGMMVLWAGCNGIEAMVREGPKAGLRRQWPLLAGALAAMVLSAATSPLGFANLTHPLWVVIGGTESQEWRQVQEWEPVLTKKNILYGTTKEFFIILGIGAALLMARLMLPGTAKQERRGDRRAKPLVGPIVFDVILALVVLRMGFMARRFVPLSTIIVAPMLAALLSWFLERIRRPRLIMALAGAMAFVTLWPWQFPLMKTHNKSFLYVFYRTYHPDNPGRMPHRDSVYDVMLSNDAYCHEAADFINANGISGRAAQGWRWEGFLHWRCPQLKLFVGGRAQQVHSLADYRLRRQIWGGRDTIRILDRLGVEFVIVPVDNSSAVIRYNMHQGAAPRWVPIYCDGGNIILADAGHENSRKFISLAKKGDLKYPTPWIKAWSEVERLCWPYFTVSLKRGGVEVPKKSIRMTIFDARRIVDALDAANNLRPTYTGYMRLMNTIAISKLPRNMIAYFSKEHRRLAKLEPGKGQVFELIRCRMLIADRLIRLYKHRNRIEDAAEVQAALDVLQTEVSALAKGWR